MLTYRVPPRYISLPLLRLNPPTERFPWDDLRKTFNECQWMAKVAEGDEKLPKIFNRLSMLHQRYRQTERRQTER